MTTAEVMEYLETHGNPDTKRIYLQHGAREPLYGAKVADLKVLAKKTGKDYQLAKDLYVTGNSDAMYFAGMIAAAGWATWAALLGLESDREVDLKEIRSHLHSLEHTIHSERNRVRYAMNTFLIAVGSYVPELTEEAKDAGTRTGKVQVDMGKTSCRVPFAPTCIEKVQQKGRIGRKRRSVRG